MSYRTQNIISCVAIVAIMLLNALLGA